MSLSPSPSHQVSLSFQGTPYSANYAATKAYVQTLAEGIAVELNYTGTEWYVYLGSIEGVCTNRPW